MKDFSFLQKICIAILVILVTAIPSESQTTKSADLIKLIKKIQSDNVRESCNEGACCCFTWIDKDAFIQNKITQKITLQMRSNKQFNEICNSIRSLSTKEWAKLKSQALATRKQTWAELGRIDCKGQTNAGKIAEKLIAQKITALVIEKLKVKAG